MESVNVIKASSFGVIHSGNLICLAFNSPEDLKEMARTLCRLANLNDTLEDGKYTRVIRGEAGVSGPFYEDEVRAIVELSDSYVPGRSVDIPVIDTDRMV